MRTRFILVIAFIAQRKLFFGLKSSLTPSESFRFSSRKQKKLEHIKLSNGWQRQNQHNACPQAYNAYARLVGYRQANCPLISMRSLQERVKTQRPSAQRTYFVYPRFHG